MSKVFSVILILAVVAFFVFQTYGLISDIKHRKRVKDNKKQSGGSPEIKVEGDKKE